MKAMVFLDYKLNGNRTNYEKSNNERRANLNRLMVGELLEAKGRFIPQIINGLWLVLEESTWVSPAHLPSQKMGIGLPHIEDPYIDLGAGRQAVDVAMAYFFFKDQFDKVSRHINVRILYELDRRILDPYLQRDDYWWMAIANEGRFVNNWNIWINTNMLKTFLLIEKDKDRLAKALQKIVVSADYFLNYYPEDGMCEEGPSYWMHSGGELGIMLSWLHNASGGKISLANEMKIRNMGEYILHTHIMGDRYVNFADAQSVEQVPAGKVWNYGALFEDSNFKKFAAFLHGRNKHRLPNASMASFVEMAAIYEDLNRTTSDYHKNTAHFYPSLGLVTLNSNNPKGNLFFAAIGGHNGVSHNHNDVGSYIVYVDSIPVLIDVGVGTYTAKTFSSRRYEIWNMQSGWHNLPIVNGVEQKDGRKFGAKDVVFSKIKSGYHYSLDIGQAYPAAAAVKSWVRDFEFRPHENMLHVAEIFSLEKQLGGSQLVFLLQTKPIVEDSSIRVVLDSTRQMVIDFKTKDVGIHLESRQIEDPRLQKTWKDEIYRIRVDVPSGKVQGKVQYTIRVI
jgi:hypothetical protein